MSRGGERCERYRGRRAGRRWKRSWGTKPALLCEEVECLDVSLCEVLRNKGSNVPAVIFVPHAWEREVFNHCKAPSNPRDERFLTASKLCVEAQVLEKKHGFIEVGGEE